MGFINRIKQIKTGNKRLLIVLSLLISLGLVLYGLTKNKDGLLIFGFISFFIFWFLVWVFLWIIDGYKNESN